MPRRKVVAKREILPDMRFNSMLAAKFINGIMQDGKKSVARNIFYGAMEIVADKAGEEGPMAVFEKAMDNVRPKLEVKSRRVGGATYQVPIEVRAERRNALAIRWLIDFSQKRGGRSMAEKLAAEFLEAADNRGSSVKKREDTHKMAAANKAFAHYRW